MALIWLFLSQPVLLRPSRRLQGNEKVTNPPLPSPRRRGEQELLFNWAGWAALNSCQCYQQGWAGEGVDRWALGWGPAPISLHLQASPPFPGVHYSGRHLPNHLTWSLWCTLRVIITCSLSVNVSHKPCKMKGKALRIPCTKTHRERSGHFHVCQSRAWECFLFVQGYF